METCCEHQYCKLRDLISSRGAVILDQYRRSMTRFMWLTPCFWSFQYRELFAWYKETTSEIKNTVSESFQIYLMARLGGEMIHILVQSGLVLPCEREPLASFYKCFNDYQLGNFQDEKLLPILLQEARFLNFHIRNNLVNKVINECFSNNLALLCGSLGDKDEKQLYELLYCDTLFSLERFHSSFVRLHRPTCVYLRRTRVTDHDWNTIILWFNFFVTFINNSFQKNERVILFSTLCMYFASMMVDCELVTGLSKKILYRLVQRFLECVETDFDCHDNLERIYYCCDLLAKDGEFFEEYSNTLKSAIELMERNDLDFYDQEDNKTPPDLHSLEAIFEFIEEVKKLYISKLSAHMLEFPDETRSQEVRQNLERWATRLERQITQLPTKYGRNLVRLRLYSTLVDLMIICQLINNEWIMRSLTAIQNYLKMFELSNMKGQVILSTLVEYIERLPDKFTPVKFLKRRLLLCSQEAVFKSKKLHKDFKATKIVILSNTLDPIIDSYFLTTLDYEDKSEVGNKIQIWVMCFVDMLENSCKGSSLEATYLLRLALKAYVLVARYNMEAATTKDSNYMEGISMELKAVQDTFFKSGVKMKKLHNYAKEGLAQYSENMNIHYILAKAIIQGCQKLDKGLSEA
ncbi:hypothetical protein Ciccas_006876 [Cichlidogyrus casuarinus]|uniref:Uncharacterized protein n=1 Tax=Cichlidogyrus casuarinus TaxID=1844966 RepID=A0ABD2Q549_9PLAT